MPHRGFESPPVHQSHHCANFGGALVRFGRGHCCVWGWNLEHGDDSLVGELDLGDERLDGGLAFEHRAAGHDRREAVPDAGDGGGRRRGGWVVEFGFELCLPGLELGEALPQVTDAGAGGGVVHGALFERSVVPDDGGLGGGDLVDHGDVLGVLVGVAGGLLGTARSIMAVRAGSAVV